MGDGEESVRVKELLAKAQTLKEGCESVATAVADFEKASKAAFVLAEKHLQPKRGGLPEDTVKKIDELKQSVSGFDGASKALVAAISGGLTKLNAQKALVLAEVESARLEDESETPEGLKKQIDAMQLELQRLTDEKVQVESTLLAKMAEIQTQSNEEKQQLVQRHTEAINALQQQLNATTDRAEIAAQKLTAEQESTARLRAAIEERDEQLKVVTSRCDRLEAENTIAAQSVKDYKAERDVFETRAKVADASRANELKAFERSLQNHELEKQEWEKKLVDANVATEVLKTEKEALRARLVDDHLREHIRSLQEENHSLREQRVRQNQDRLAEKTKDIDVSALLTTQFRELEKERSQFEAKLSNVQREMVAKDTTIFDLTVAIETERSAHAARVAALERQLFMSQLSPEKLEKERALSQTMASVPVVVRHVGTIALDTERDELHSQLKSLRASNAELRDRLEITEKGREQERRELESKLVSEVGQTTTEIHTLNSQLKAAKYKIAKLQQELSESVARSNSMASVRPVDAEALEEQAAARRQKLERQAVEASLEAEGLRVRIRTLQRELEDQRERYEALLRDVREAKVNQPKSPETLSRGASDRALKQARIDDQLLGLHEEALRLDEKERMIENRRVASDRQLRERLLSLENVLGFWQSPRNATERGPDGETSQQMVEMLSREQAQLAAQLDQIEQGTLKFFKEVGDKRNKLFRTTSELLQTRAAL